MTVNIDFKLKIRENKLIRTLAYPWKTWKNAQSRQAFAQSEDAARLKGFHGIHAGERCFIIGNGPSLTTDDLELLKGEVTFAANRIYRIYDQTDWRPTYWMCVDPYILAADHALISSLPGTRFVSDLAKGMGVSANESLFMIHNHQPYYINKYSDRIRVAFSEDIASRFEAGETVTYNAIQFAAYMGFREMYLLGVDHSYSQRMNKKGKLEIDRSVKDYFGNVRTEKFNIQNHIVSTKAYESARQYAQAHGIKIWNATRGGKLEVFPRIQLDELFIRMGDRVV